jgi:hypothetical protein
MITVLARVGGGLFVYDARLHPEHLRSGGHGVLGNRKDRLAPAEHVHDVHIFRDLRHPRIRLLAEHRAFEVRVDGEDPVAEALEGAGDGMAGTVRPVREADDRDGSGLREEVTDLFWLRVPVHGSSYSR